MSLAGVPLKRLGANTRCGLRGGRVLPQWGEGAAPHLAPSLGMAGQLLELPPGPRVVEKGCEGREANEAIQHKFILLGSL